MATFSPTRPSQLVDEEGHESTVKNDVLQGTAEELKTVHALYICVKGCCAAEFAVADSATSLW